MSTISMPQEKATYVASKADQHWLLSEQEKLYTRSWEDPQYTFRKLWGLITDLRNLRCALMRVSKNKGSCTAGVDRVTVRSILAKEQLYKRYGTRELWKRSVYWGDGRTDCFRLSALKVQRFRLGWLRTPDFAVTSMESPVHNERCTPGSEEWAPETAR
jgi:hypothetical protein